MARSALVFAVVVAVNSSARADDGSPRTTAVADLGLHVIGAGVQYQLAPHVVVAGDLDFYAPWTEMRHLGFTANAVQGTVVRARAFYFVRPTPTGLWVSPFAQVGVATTLRAGAATSTVGATWAAGASVGYAWLVGRVAILVGAGAQYHAAYLGAGAPSYHTPWPHADAIVGWTF